MNPHVPSTFAICPRLADDSDNHLAGLGTMAELVAPNERGRPGHEGYLRAGG